MKKKGIYIFFCLCLELGFSCFAEDLSISDNLNKTQPSDSSTEFLETKLEEELFVQNENAFVEQTAITDAEEQKLFSDEFNFEENSFQYKELELEGAQHQLTKKIREQFLTERGQKIIIASLKASELYLPYIRQKLEEKNLPMILQYLPIVESNFVPQAVSKTGATGIWQFMENSMAPFLKKDPWFDERRDPWLSTDAALAKLSENFKITPKIYATDIDLNALQTFKRGLYGSHSFRDDGKKFHHVLDKLKATPKDTFINALPIISNIQISPFNLVKDDFFPFEEGTIDFIFLRNVFIYFDEKTREQILEKISRALKNDGILFLSVSEIPCIEPSDSIPLVKQHSKNVYYLKKIPLEEKRKFTKSGNTLNLLQNTKPPKKENNFEQKHFQSSAKNLSFAQKEKTKNLNLCDSEKQEKTITVSEQNVVDICELCLDFVSKKNYLSASESLEAYTFSPATMEYRWYLEGIIAVEKKDKKSALEFFSKASLLNGRFWPALFQAGLLLKESGDAHSSKKMFLSCAKELDSYIQNEKTCYNFLMEQFSPDYFLQLCNTYIKQEEGR